MARQYYSVRSGRNPLAGGFDLDTMRNLFLREIFIHFEDEGLFQELLGYIASMLASCPAVSVVASKARC